MVGEYTVVVPAYNAAATLASCLQALKQARPAPAEIIVSDDASTDGTVALAKAFGAKVISNASNRGPAAARNRGALAASSGIVVFVDADVVVDPAAPGLLAEAVSDADVKAAFGAYAPTSDVKNLAGRYANLRHHYIHRSASERSTQASTFWSGLGAVDRMTFLAVGGFDKSYARPCIEDVEFGLRLRRAEWQITIVPEAMGQHLKNWTLRSLWETDIRHRALPWSELICQGLITGTLNTTKAEKFRTLLALATVSSLVCPLLFGLPLLSVPFILLIAFALANRNFLRVLLRDSLALAAAGLFLHLFYYCYAAATFAVVACVHRMEKLAAPRGARLELKRLAVLSRD
jgi:GT2 family glycosyltransferase